MKREFHRWYSHRLGLELGVVVYGHWGSPLVGFPTSAGDEWELEGQSLIGTLADFIDAGYDRQPDFTIGLTNTFHYKRFTLDFLVDIRKGGDVFDATDHYLTTHGLSMMTLDRDQPRVIDGVLRDGKENSANPTVNTIVVVPGVQRAYYTNMSEELFIERDINWLRLRDVQLSCALPQGFLGSRNASVFVKGTDLLLITNYTGLDPIVNGNSAAVGGSGGVAIDFGNFPMPAGVNFGIRMDF